MIVEATEGFACELEGCRSRGRARFAVGLFQVYDGALATLTRPALLCRRCVAFAKQCGMTPKRHPLADPEPQRRPA